MKWKPFVFAWALALTLLLFAQRRNPWADRPAYTNVFDLTYAVGQSTPPAKMQRAASANSSQSAYYMLDEQTTTRLEAPAYRLRGMWTVDQIPAERLVRPLVVIDVHRKARRDNDYRLSMQDVADWEQNNGRIPQGAVIAAYTGWQERWNTPALYRNASADGTMHFPGFTLEAAEFLVEARNAVGLAIDTMSTDGGNSSSYSVHKFCAEHSVYHLENVANLARVPSSGATAVVTPLKLDKGAGAPVRVLAMMK